MTPEQAVITCQESLWANNIEEIGVWIMIINNYLPDFDITYDFGHLWNRYYDTPYCLHLHN